MRTTEAQRAARQANITIATRIKLTREWAAIAARIAAGKKRRSWCRQTRPLSDFYVDNAHPDGHRYECRACTVASREARRNGKPLDGWRLKCCGGDLVDDPVTGWWICLHRPRCTSRWQPWLGDRELPAWWAAAHPRIASGSGCVELVD